MPPEQPPGPLDALRSAIDGHLSTLAEQLEQAVAEARRQALTEAEQSIAGRVEMIRRDWQARLDAELAEARGEAERRVVAEAARARVEAEEKAAESAAAMRAQLEAAFASERQDAAEALKAAREEAEAQQKAAKSAAAMRAQLEAAFASERQEAADALKAAREQAAAQRQAGQRAESLVQAERQRMDAQLQAERERAQAEMEAQRTQAEERLDAERARFEEQLQAERARAQPKTHAPADALVVTERQVQLAGFERVVGAMRSLDEACSLTEALDALLAHAGAVASRAALFLVNGDRLKSWKTNGFPQLDAHPFDAAITGTSLLAQAIQTGEPVGSGPAQPAPTFAAVPADRAGLAVPLIVGGRPVALLYVDNVGRSPAESPASWPEVIQSLARHASTVLALLTAMRTVQALGNGSPKPLPDGVDEQSARRYARLLVSEIKLYNEGAVRVGRQQHDLLSRLHEEIDRARRLYEEKIPSAVAARGLYFQQELVQTLADGDPALLGQA